MNEYVSHGTNGLLHAPGHGAPLDFGQARAIGARARESIQRGRARWDAGLPALLDFIATPKAVIAARGATIAAPPALPREWHLHDGEGVRQDADALRRAIAEAPPDAQVIRGHHLTHDSEGRETLHRVGDFEAAWARLLDGDVGPKGPRGLGVPEATLIRDSLLRHLDAAAPQTAQQLAALLRRAVVAGAAIHDVDHVLARRNLPEDWPAQRRGWYQLVAAEAGAAAAARVLAALDDTAAAAEASHRAAHPARMAIRLIALCDRCSPALGRAVESFLLGGGLRRLRGLVRR